MARSMFSGSIASPKIDVTVDMGNPFLNRTVDGFLKIGTVAASRVAVEETYHCVQRGIDDVGLSSARKSRYAAQQWHSAADHIWISFPGSICKGKLEDALKRMCKEGAYWGTVAGVYVGVEYGMERMRGTRDWKNAMLGGAITGLLISAASNNGRDKVVKDAITAGAVATAAELINYLT